MKRKSAIILFLAMFLIFPMLALAAPVGKFTAIEGSVDVTPPGKEAVSAKLGDELNVGDIIRTKSKSKCEVAFIDGSILRLAENSRLRVSEFKQEKEERSATLNLFRGKIQNIVKTVAGTAAERSKYEIHMPTAVCGVRGTNFFAFFQAGVSGAIFTEGTGYGYSLNRPQEVRTITVGQSMVVTSPDLPPVIKPATAVEIDQHQKDTTPSEKPKDEGKKDEEPAPPTPSGGWQPPDPEPPPPPEPERWFPEPQSYVPPDVNDVTPFSSPVTGSDFLTSGTLSGELDNTTNKGSLSLSGGYAAAPPPVWWGEANGTLGSSTFDGYLVGVSGSWEGVLSSIYVTGQGAGFLFGSLSGTYDESNNTLSGSGSAKMTEIYGLTVLAPADLTANGLNNTWTYPLPILGSITVGGAVTSTAATTSWEMMGIDTFHPENGLYRGLAVWRVATGGGTYANTGGVYTEANPWQGIYGQSGFFNDNPSNAYYMLGPISGTDDGSGHVGISGDLAYMEYGLLGTISLEYRGKYDGTGSYTSVGAGALVLDQWAFGDVLSPTSGGSFHYMQGNSLTSAGSLDGFWGGTGNLLSGNSPYLMMGKYSGNPAAGAIFTADAAGDAAGFIGGRLLNGSIETDFAGLYATDTETGFLISNGTPGYSTPGTDPSVWMASGSISAYSMEAVPATSPVLSDTVHSFSPSLPNEYPGGPAINPAAERVRTSSFVGYDWGIEQTITGGAYTGTITGAANTAWTIDHTAYVNDTIITTDTSFTTTDTTWNGTDKTIAGRAAYAVADWQEGKTLIGGGSVKGVFDSDAHTWQVVSTGGWLETSIFKNMLTTEDGRTVLQALNIPSILVGSVTLSQAAGTTINNLSDVTLANVGFYAYATGSAPRIWATGDVSGDYTGTPALEGPLVSLTGGGLNAYFGIRNWDSDNGIWGANIIGGGSLSGYAGKTGFSGGAAGQFGDGSLTGTAAGTASGNPVSSDNTAPSLAFAGPATYTNNPSGDFTLSSPETGAIYRYSFDGSTYTSTSGSLSFTGLSEGQHTLALTGADTAGNVALTSYTWTTDYIPPTIALSSQPREVTGNNTASDLSIDITDANPDPNALYYRYYQSGDTWEPLNDQVVFPEGMNKIEFKANDLAGNESDTTSPISYEWFIGKRQYVLKDALAGNAGGVTGSLSGSVLDTSEGIRVISTLSEGSSNGAWLIDMGGSGSPSGTVILTAGGRGYGPYLPEDTVTINGETPVNGYWLSHITADAAGGEITGTSALTYLSATTLGQGSGDVTGTYGSGLWQAQDLGFGTYTETPLAYSSHVSQVGFAYWNSDRNELINESLESPYPLLSPIIGILGGINSLFNETAGQYVPAPLIGMGSYDHAAASGYSLWAGEIAGSAGADAQFISYYGGIRIGDSLRGRALGIYVKGPAVGGEYEAGIIKSNEITANLYPGIDMWELTEGSSLTASAMSLTTVSPADLLTTLDAKSFTASIGDGAITGNLSGNALMLPGQPWGVMYFGIGGSYEGAPNTDWNAKVGKWATGTDTGTGYWWKNYWIANITGGAWDAVTGSFSGSLSGRELNVDSDGDNYYAVSAGDILGTYGNGTYQGIGLGASVSTPLAFGGAIGAPEMTLPGGFGYWDFTQVPGAVADAPTFNVVMSGLIGSDLVYDGSQYVADSLFKGTTPGIGSSYQPASFLALGNYDSATIGNKRLFATKVEGGGPDFGADGYLAATFGGIRTGNSLTGKLLGLYVKSEEGGTFEAGYFTSGPLTGGTATPVTAALYPDIGMWETTANNQLTATLMASGLDGMPVFPQTEPTPNIASVTGDGGIAGNMVLSSRSLIVNGQELGWGMWTSTGGGTYTTIPTPPSDPNEPLWKAVAGWTETSGDVTTYGITHVAGTSWSDNKLAGTVGGRIMTSESLVTLTGDILGVYPAAAGTAYSWETVGIGTFIETPLVLSGPLATDAGFMFTDADGYAGWDGSLSGIIGSTALPWSGGSPNDSHALLAMGTYANPNNRQVWMLYNPVYSALSESYLPTMTTDGGALLGDMAGVIRPDGATEGVYGAIFVRPDGQDGQGNQLYKGGYIGYNLAGGFYPGIGSATAGSGMWEITGTPYAYYEQTVTGITPDTLNWYNITDREAYGSAAGAVSINPFSTYFYSLPGQHWGGWSTSMAGALSTLPGNEWSATAGGGIDKGIGESHTADGYWLADLSGSAWTDGMVNGNINYRYITKDAIGTFGNTLFGAYQGSTGNYNWQAVSGGVYTEEPLAFGGDWSWTGTGIRYNNNGMFGNYAIVSGLIGGSQAFWEEGGASYLGMGDFTVYAGVGTPGLCLFDPYVQGQGTFGGVTADFFGWAEGFWKDGAIDGDTGGIVAIYKTSAGDAGILWGTIPALASSYYPDINMWKIEGALTPTPMPLNGFDLAGAEYAQPIIAENSLSGSFGNGSGSFESPFGGSTLTSFWYNDSAGSINSPYWGIFYHEFGNYNNFYNKPPGETAWSALAGGTGIFGAIPGTDAYSSTWFGDKNVHGDKGYWMATVKGDWTAGGKITGMLGAISGDETTFGRYITPTQTGTISGPFYGIADITGLPNGDGTVNGTWVGESIGTFEGQPLAYSGSIGTGGEVIGPGSLYYNNGGIPYLAAHESGLFGGVYAPWAPRVDSTFDFTAIGPYSPVIAGALTEPRYLWSTAVYGYANDESGAYIQGTIAGLWQKTGGTDYPQGSVAGALRALYAGPLYNTSSIDIGMVAGDLSGNYYTFNATDGSGMWTAAGGLTSIPKTSGLNNEYLALSGGDMMNIGLAGAFTDVPGSIIANQGGGSTQFFTYSGYSQPGMNWGIYDLTFGGGGTFLPFPKPPDTSPTQPATWSAVAGGTGVFGAILISGVPADDIGYWLATINGTWNDEGVIRGYMGESPADDGTPAFGTYLTKTQMGTIGGPFYGVNTTTGSWIGESVGTFEGQSLALSGRIVGSAEGSIFEGLIGGTTSTENSGVKTFSGLLAMGQIGSNGYNGPFNAIAGGKTSFTTADQEGYWMANSSSGTWGTGGFSSGSWSGAYISPTQIGTISSSTSFTGSYYDNIGMWQSADFTLEASQTGTPLLYANRIEGDLYQQNNAILHSDQYEKPVAGSYFDTMRAETMYVISENAAPMYGLQMAKKEIVSRGHNSESWDAYYPSNEALGYTSSNNVPRMDRAKTSDLTVQPDLSTSPPTLPSSSEFGYADISPDTFLNNPWPVTGEETTPIDVLTTQYAKTSEGEYDLNVMERVLPPSAARNETFQGIMGLYQLEGTGAASSLWATSDVNPLGLAFLGAYQDADLPLVFQVKRFYSQNYAVSGSNPAPTPDGGAYYGIMTGTLSGDRSLNAALYGLYVSPTVGGTWEAGILRTTAPLTGTSYAGVNMWDAEGQLYKDPMALNLTTGVDAAHLLDQDLNSLGDLHFTNIDRGAMGDATVQMKNLYGGFDTGGYITSLAGVGFGSTLSIKGLPDFGIFEMLHGGIDNTYSKPADSTTFSMDMASTGQFGKYDRGSNNTTNPTYSDFGFWTASINGTVGTLSDPDKLSGTWSDGYFLTYKKEGTISGDFMGNLKPDGPESTTGIWQGASAGSWEKTRDVIFSSGIVGDNFSLQKTFRWIGSGNNFYDVGQDPQGGSLHPYRWAYFVSTSGSITTITQFDEMGPPGQEVYSKTVWVKNSDGSFTLQEASKLQDLAAFNTAIDDLRIYKDTAEITDNYRMERNDQHDGILAGFDSNLWTNVAGGSPTNISLIGQYGQDHTGVSPPTVFGGTIISFDPMYSMNPYYNATTNPNGSKLPIGGAYYGYLGAVFGTQSGGVTADWVDGLINSLYRDPSGNVGILYGTFTGNNNPDIGAWKGTGAIDGGYAFGMAGGSLTEANFASKVSVNSRDWSYGAGEATLLTGDNITLNAASYNSAAISNSLLNPPLTPSSGFFGIWQNRAGGTFTGSPDIWSWEAKMAGNQTDYISVQMNTEINGVKTGDVVGASAVYDASIPFTSVMGGKIKGLFDPIKFTWQAVSQGTVMETATFVSKVSSFTTDAQRQAFTDATKIPCFAVGSTDLRGSGSVTGGSIDLGSAAVTTKGVLNTTFYAPSTGGPAQIWASGNVTGAYTGAPTAGNVILSGYAPGSGTGNGITANFGISNWNNNSNGKWGATISGAVSPGTPGFTYQNAATIGIVFQGGAAGTITGSTFTGTAAGIAPPPLY